MWYILLLFITHQWEVRVEDIRGKLSEDRVEDGQQGIPIKNMFHFPGLKASQWWHPTDLKEVHEPTLSSCECHCLWVLLTYENDFSLLLLWVPLTTIYLAVRQTWLKTQISSCTSQFKILQLGFLKFFKYSPNSFA